MKAKYFVVLFAVAGYIRAQQPGEDPLREYLFPPELVIENQQAIGLTGDQTILVKMQMAEAMLQFMRLQGKLKDEMGKMVSLLKQPKVDEQQLLAELDKVLEAEREIKRTQIQLLIRIRNNLTPEQQNKLRELQTKPGAK